MRRRLPRTARTAAVTIAIAGCAETGPETTIDEGTPQLDGLPLTVTDGFGIGMDKTADNKGEFGTNDRVRVFLEGSGFTVPGDGVHVYHIRLHSINNPDGYDPATDVAFDDTPVADGLSTQVNVRKENIRITKYLPTGKKGRNAIEIVDRDTCVGEAIYAFTVEPGA